MEEEDETIACIKEEHIKYLETGQLSKHVFPLSRKEAHKKKICHLIVRVFLMSLTPNDEILFLVQKRSRNKKSYPNFFSDSSSGHVMYKDRLNFEEIKENALREIEEELGIPPKSIQLLHFERIEREKDEFTGEIAYVFFGLVDSNVKLKPNPKEVDVNATKFYTKNDLKKILAQRTVVDYSRKIWKELLESNMKSHFEKVMDNNPDNKGLTGLFIGRFQPFHHGHVHVLNIMRKECQFMKIGIGSAQLSHEKNNPFTAKERREFIKAVLKKRGVSPKTYEIYEIPDIFNANKWVDHVISIVGNFDMLYSNSDWVRDLFQKKGYKITKKHLIFKNKFNGTHIRNLISKNDKTYRSLIPNEVIDIINQIDGLERIRKLNKINK
ncbi:MAG: nicotinamide-nucleotide adenylyltransferase [Promethearchaeota archaeon]